MTVKSLGKSANVEKEIICHNCGSILRYVPNDIKEENRTDYLGDTDILQYIKCVDCKKKVYIL